MSCARCIANETLQYDWDCKPSGLFLPVPRPLENLRSQRYPSCTVALLTWWTRTRKASDRNNRSTATIYHRRRNTCRSNTLPDTPTRSRPRWCHRRRVRNSLGRTPPLVAPCLSSPLTPPRHCLFNSRTGLLRSRGGEGIQKREHEVLWYRRPRLPQGIVSSQIISCGTSQLSVLFSVDHWQLHPDDIDASIL